MNKRGQFFLFAALVTIGALISLNQTFNYATGKEVPDAFYDLSDEVNFETKRVLDYGVFNERDVEELMNGFLEKYAKYIEKEEVLFIYGNANNLQALVFDHATIGSVNLGLGGSVTGVTIQAVRDRHANVSVSGSDVVVKIDDVKYYFTLREGQNFGLLIVKVEGEERFVAQRG